MSGDLAARLAQRALALCRIPSPIGQEAAIADWVEAWAKERYAPQEILRKSHSFVLGNLQDPRPAVLLVGHLDTVPPHPTDAPPRIEGDRLHGLGASDMKGGVAVMLALAEDLPRSALPVNLLLLLYEREEGPYLESGLGPLFEAAPMLSKAKLGIALEPTDGAIQVGCVGSLHVTLRFKGKSAHSARPWQGENAIHRAGPLLAELLEKPRREVQIDGFPFFEVFSITKASGGRARNVIPDELELNLNYRFAPGKSVAQARDDVRALIGGRAEVEVTDEAPSGRVCTDNPLLAHLRSTSGFRAEAKQAWTDVARLSAMGVDAVNLGPGETAQAHQARESAGIPAMAVVYEALAEFLRTAPARRE
ncbi:MAG TPA: succinyl-diaminopimelate desuccinylase [Myxococcaceae bacterium]|nr:succinyl-diaminopimelate desuccinylase [Myxococcaceae bacterium]